MQKHPKIGSVVTVSATRSGYTQVTVAAPMSLNVNGKLLRPDITLSDPEHFVAIALVSESKTRGEGDTYAEPSTLLVFRMRTGATARSFLASSHANGVLPAGTYRLIVVTSAPQRISWRLPSKGKPIVVTAAHPVTPHWGFGSSTGGPAVFNVAAHFPTAPVSQIWSFAWMRGTRVRRVGTGSYCLYNGEDQLARQEEGATAFACNGVGTFGGPVDGVELPPSATEVDELVFGGVALVDAVQGVNAPFLPQVGAKFTLALGGTVEASSTLQLWLPLA